MTIYESQINAQCERGMNPLEEREASFERPREKAEQMGVQLMVCSRRRVEWKIENVLRFILLRITG